MKWVGSVLFWLVVLGLTAWALGLDDLLRGSITSGRLLDLVMGVLCLAWLIVLLKAPWDLFFQAQEAAFEIQRSKEREIAVLPGREMYIRTLRRRLALLAVGAHVFSAALVAAISYFTGGGVGYWFAVFFLVSTFFRPVVAGYVYLSRKLSALIHEVQYPREDVAELRQKVEWQEQTLRNLTGQLEQCREILQTESRAREGEDRDLRQRLHALSREFETTASRLTDNQEVIKGIQAFVRLISQSASPAAPGQEPSAAS